MAWIDVQGNKIYYEDTGNGAPVIFLHGNPGTHRLWQYQSSHFKDRYRVLGIDMRGFGQSDKPVGADYHPSALASDIAEIISRLNLNRPVLAGLSMGSMVSLALALEYPERIGGLILAGTTSDRRDRDPEKELQRLRRLGFDLYLSQLVTSWYMPDADPQLIEWTLSQVRTTEQHVREATIAALARFHVTDRLREIKVPTLIMAGDTDAVTPADRARTIQERILESELVVFPNAGHMFIAECPDQVNPVMDKFLQRIGHRARGLNAPDADPGGRV